MTMQKNFFNEQFKFISGEKLELRLIDTFEGRDGGLPFYWWDIILKEENTAIGKISLRIGHNYYSYFNGNIGYEIDEAYRGHHYALQACRLVLRAAKYHKMGKVYLTCDYNNAASWKTIEKLGANLLEEVRPPEDYIYYYEGIKPHKIYELRVE